MKLEFLECGQIVAPHGVRGEVRLQPWCDEPAFLLDLKTLYRDHGRDNVTVEQARLHKNVVILKLQGVEAVEEAERLRGVVLYVRREDVPLDEGECFVQDLLGCDVLDADTDRNYGKIVDVRPTGANDVYYLRDENGKERLVPVIPDVVLEKNLEKGVVRIRPLEGLFDD